jgi:cell division protein FtsB
VKPNAPHDIQWSPRSVETAKGRNMARALLGHLPTSADRHLIDENARLKARVRDLEAQLAELKDSMSSVELLDELHRITTSASALA